MKVLRYLIFLSLFFSVSCAKEEDPEYEPYVKGSIIGYAMLTDQYGNLLDDHRGVTVYTEPGSKYSGTTDITGRFEIKGVPTGTYNLSFEKDGFGTMWYPEVHHLGGKPTLLGTPSSDFPYWNRFVLHENITLQIADIYVFQENRIKVDVAFTGVHHLEGLYARLFFSESDGFSVQDAVGAVNVTIYDSGGYFDELTDLPFESGTTIYCRGSLFTSGAYMVLAEGLYAMPVDSYIDEVLGTTIYPNLTDESEQYAFIMP